MKEKPKVILLNLVMLTLLFLGFSVVAYTSFSGNYYLPFQQVFINDWEGLFLFLAPFGSFLVYSFFWALIAFSAAVLITLFSKTQLIQDGYFYFFERR